MNHKSKSQGRRIFMDDLSHGVEATLIDLGLSRMDAGDGGRGDRVHWTPFDEEVFMGEGRFHLIPEVQVN
jgi:serine/threonine-protein kinase haspin